jgi:hypothetical protein
MNWGNVEKVSCKLLAKKEGYYLQTNYVIKSRDRYLYQKKVYLQWGENLLLDWFWFYHKIL